MADFQVRVALTPPEIARVVSHTLDRYGYPVNEVGRDGYAVWVGWCDSIGFVHTCEVKAFVQSGERTVHVHDCGHLYKVSRGLVEALGQVGGV